MMTKSNLNCCHRYSRRARRVLTAPGPHFHAYIFMVLLIHSRRLLLRVVLFFRMFLVVICDSWLVGGEVKESWEYAFCLFILLQLLIDKVLASKLGLGQRILEEGLVGGGAGSPLVSTAVGVNAYT